jgi:formiminoglutamase
METFSLSRGTSPLILSMPHPGTMLPPEIAAALNPRGHALEDTDWHMRRLYAGIEARLEPTVIEATLSRYVIDLNRDPAGASLYPGQTTTALVPETTFSGAPIWHVPPDAVEIARRRTLYFEPYHAALAGEIARVRRLHGWCLVWDCHSILSVVPRLFAGQLPLLNLGTHGGLSCAPAVAAAAEQAMAASGLTHVSNGRFKGGFITRHYGRPAERVHAIQMEISLNGYLVEEAPPWSFAPDGAQPLQSALEQVIDAALDAALDAAGGLA